MFEGKNSLQAKIPGGTYVNLGDYITEVTYMYPKAWGDDTGRNTLSGKFSGTFVGIFPKIRVKFRKLTKSELEIITPIIDNKNQILKYYDPNKHTYVEMETYTNDYEVMNKKIIESNYKKNEPFEVSFIAIDRRT